GRTREGDAAPPAVTLTSPPGGCDGPVTPPSRILRGGLLSALVREGDVVLGADLPDGAAAGAHHHAVGLRPAAVVEDAAEQAAARDPGDLHTHLGAGDEGLHGHRRLGVEARGAHRGSLLLVAPPAAALQLAPEPGHGHGGPRGRHGGLPRSGSGVRPLGRRAGVAPGRTRSVPRPPTSVAMIAAPMSPS